MKPGVTYLPVASITVVACASPSRPTATMRPSLTATSAGNQGLPLPSSTRPFRIRRSNGCGRLADPENDQGGQPHHRGCTAATHTDDSSEPPCCDLRALNLSCFELLVL